MKKLALKLALLPFAVPIIILGASTNALAGDDVSVSVSLDYALEYVFRGVTLASDVIQPGAEIAFGNFTAGAWLSLPVDDSADAFADELDLYASYSFSLSESVSADVGATLYHYPQSGGLFDIGTDAGDASTLELFGSLGFGGTLEPSLSAFYDLTLEAFTVEAGVSHSIPVGEALSFDMGAAVGAVSVSGSGDYQYGSASGALTYALSDAASAYIGVNAGFSSDDTFLKLSNLTPRGSSAWFGAGISTGF